MQALIVTVAAVGAELTPEQTPHLAVHARAARRNGAAVARGRRRRSFTCTAATTTERTRTAWSDFASAYEAIREQSDLIVQFSTGGAIGMTPDERASGSQLAPGDGDADLRHRQLRRRHLREQLSDHARDSEEDERVRRAPGARDLRQGPYRQRAPARAREAC